MQVAPAAAVGAAPAARRRGRHAQARRGSAVVAVLGGKARSPSRTPRAPLSLGAALAGRVAGQEPRAAPEPAAEATAAPTHTPEAPADALALPPPQLAGLEPPIGRVKRMGLLVTRTVRHAAGGPRALRHRVRWRVSPLARRSRPTRAPHARAAAPGARVAAPGGAGARAAGAARGGAGGGRRVRRAEASRQQCCLGGTSARGHPQVSAADVHRRAGHGAQDGLPVRLRLLHPLGHGAPRAPAQRAPRHAFSGQGALSPAGSRARARRAR
jgi:hypothetical protein